jgi:phosphate transport system protein
MRHFFEELDSLRGQLVDMAALVKSSIHKSVLCLTERNPDFADQVIRDEELINRDEITIDDLAIRLATLNQPVASDMRLLIAALKINTDLERMGDLAMNSARRSLMLIEAPPLDPPVPIPALSDLVENMVASAITAFVENDAGTARSVLLADDDVDRLRNEIYEDLSQRMEEQSGLVRRALGYMFIARNLERIADHATNIAEDVIFLVRGVDVRHHSEV